MKGLFSVVILATILQLCYGTEDPCSTAKCSNMTMSEVLNRLWTATTNITPLGKKFQYEIVSQAEKLSPNDPQLFVLTAQTVWATYIYSDYQHPTLTSSGVFEDILNLQFNPFITNAEYNKILKNYGNIALKASEFTVELSLRAAGCPVESSNKPSRKESLPSGNAVRKFLETKKSSEPLAKIIEELNNSDDPRDRTVALIPAMLSGGPLVELCSHVEKTDEFLNVLRLNACTQKIPLDCCKFREQEIKKRLEIAVPVVMNNLAYLMKE